MPRVYVPPMILTQCAICTAPTFREEYDTPAVCGDCFADGRKPRETDETENDHGYESQRDDAGEGE